MTADDLIDWGYKYYSRKVAALILWDLTRANVSELTSDEIRLIAALATKIASVRHGGKTAFVLKHPLNIGVGRMIQAHSGEVVMPFSLRVFRSIDEAKQWLGV